VTFSHQIDVSDALACMTAAYDAGINFFDNAEVYAHGKSEIIMGEVLRRAGWPRDSYIVSSKVMWGSVPEPRPTQRGLSRKHVVEACDHALARLGVDHLDLYFCHRPDPYVPIEETVRAMSVLIWRGKVLYWGTSEWSAQQIMEAYAAARQYQLIPPTKEQPQYNMFHRQRVEVEYGRLYESMGLGLTIWSPLATGFLTGKYNAGVPDDSRAALPSYGWLRKMIESDTWQSRVGAVKRLQKVADELDTTLPCLALAWCLKNPHVSTVITGASRIEQLKENLNALTVVGKLGEDVMTTIEDILGTQPEPLENQ
jgi:voltage-dependent potassium channel beta subunit